jgi:tetratricopeptide (TPR) repeat protein
MSEPASANLPPPLASKGVIPFHLLNERPKEFERLVRALMEDDPSLKNVDLFGIEGQAQFGVDGVAGRVADNSRDVVSCKCVEEATVAKLKKWSKDFLDHQEKQWPGVKRFILATAARNITSTKLLDQRETEARRFANVGIVYEVWGPEQLTARIRKAGRSVAVQYLHEAWAEALFGKDVPAILSAAQVEQVNNLIVLNSENLAARLTAAMQQLRAGDLEPVERLLADVRVPSQWSQLRAPTQAQTLRLAASVALSKGDMAAATKLSEEALALDPTIRRMAAVIAARAVGPAAALPVLGDPVSRLDRQLHAALLLDAERPSEAADALDLLVAEDPDDWETQRIPSRLRAMENRRGEARAAAERAYAMAPKDLQVIRSLAMARYAQALSPMAPVVLATLPIPGDPDLVRIDDAARANLEAALALFTPLTERAKPERTDRAWRLACLANLLPDRHADASELCRAMLTEDPTDALVINWGMARGLGFDRMAAEAALAELYAAGKATGDQVRVYGLMVAQRDGLPAATQTLAAHLAAQTGDAAEAATHWIEGGAPPAMDPNLPSPATVADALDKAEASKNWTAVEALLAQFLGGDTPNVIGLDLASAMAEQRRWRTIAPFAEALAKFETARATRLAIYALHHAGSAQALLDFAAQRHGDFPNGQLPLDCRRMVLMATERVNDLPSALDQAQRIAAETGDITDRLNLADIHIQAANVQAALTPIREALAANALGPDRAIRYSLAVTREDVALSRDLWRAALAGGVPDSLLLHAFSQGYKLGLNAEAETLLPRVHARAQSGAGDVWLVDIDDVVQEMVARRDRSQNLSDLLAAGATPIHLVASALNISIADHYWLAPRAKEKGALRPLFLRHGARPTEIPIETPWERWQVHLDVTSLLLLDQLDLWPHLDALESPVRVSPRLTDAILKLELDATHHQISQVEIAQAILNAHRDRRLKVQDTPATEAETVRHERPLGGEVGVGPTVRSVLGSLGRSVRPAEDGMDEPPRARGRLLFVENTLETLAMDHALEAVLDGFACEVPQSVIDDAAETVRAAADRETLADWIGELKKKVSLRQESGQFQRVAHRPINLAEGDGEDAASGGGDEAQAVGGDKEIAEDASPTNRAKLRRPDFIEQGMMDLLAAPGGVNSMLWIDDRHVTGYPLAETKIVVGTMEVLDALLAAQRITPEEHRQKLLQLRAGGAVFLPTRIEEVLVPLKAAAIVDGEVVESKALVVLRRNLAAAMRLDGKLKIGPTDIPNLEGRPDETPFMVGARRIVHDCLTELWGDDDATVEELRAQSDWLWSALRQEQPMRMLPGGDSASTLLAAINLAALLSAIPNVGSAPWGVPSPRRTAMMEWLNETAIAPLADNDAGDFLDLVATHLANLVSDEDRLDAVAKFDLPLDQTKAFLGRFRRRVFDLAPVTIQERLLKHPEFLADTGVGSVGLLTVNGVNFSPEAFWSAVTRALRNGSAKVRSQADVQLTLKQADDGGLALSGALRLRLREPWFHILAAEGHARSEAIEKYLAAKDLAPDDLSRVEAAVRDAKSDSDLVEALQDARGASLIDHYAQLSDAIGARAIKHLSEFLPPPAGQMVHHLRLGDLTRSVADQAPDAWRELADRIGVGKALRRLGGLPVPLAAAIKRAVSNLDDLPPSFSPTTALHLAATARLSGDGKRAVQILNDELAGTPLAGRLFNTLLHWTARAYTNDPAWRALPTGHQLALVWSHAHRVCTLTLQHGAKADLAREDFEKHPAQQDMLVGLWRNQPFDSDCAAPDQMLAGALFFAGLGYVFGDDDVAVAAPDLTAAIQSTLFAKKDGEVILDAGLMLWNPDAANAMGSFVATPPVIALDPPFDPSAARRHTLEVEMSRLEEKPTDILRWATVNRLSDTGLPADLQTRLIQVFDAVKIEEIDGGQTPIQGPAMAIDTRLGLPGELNADVIDRKIVQLAKHYADALRGTFRFNDEQMALGFTIVVEAAARAAIGPDMKVALQRLGSLMLVVAYAWPAAAAPLRKICDSYARASSPETGAPLWRALVALRAWP